MKQVPGVHPEVALRRGRQAVYLEGRARWLVEILSVSEEGGYAWLHLRYLRLWTQGRAGKSVPFWDPRGDGTFRVSTHLKEANQIWSMWPVKRPGHAKSQAR